MSQIVNASSLVYFLSWMTFAGIYMLVFSLFVFDVGLRVSDDACRVAYRARILLVLMANLVMIAPVLYTMISFHISYADLWNAVSKWPSSDGKILASVALYTLSFSPFLSVYSLGRSKKALRELAPEVNAAARMGHGMG